MPQFRDRSILLRSSEGAPFNATTNVADGPAVGATAISATAAAAVRAAVRAATDAPGCTARDAARLLVD